MAEDWINWTLDTDDHKAVWLTLDAPDQRVNTLTRSVLEEFSACLDAVEARKPSAVFITSGKESGFIAGADVHELADATPSELHALLREAHHAMARLEDLDAVTIAVIRGPCLGGGLELALACDWRVAETGATFGFPEVQLGLHPGLGATWRLPRVVEPSQALRLMLTGKTIDARKARSLGLVDDSVPERHMDKATRAAAENDRASGNFFRKAAIATELTQPVRSIIALQARKQTSGRVRTDHYPAPVALIDLFENEGDERDDRQAAEAKSFVELIQSDAARNLIRLFKLREAAKHDARGDHGIRHVHVIGAGTMGADIAMWTALQGFTVTLEDIKPAAIGKAIGKAAKWFDRKKDRSDDILNPEDRLIGDPSGNGARIADLVIEAAPEDESIKEKIYSSLKDRLMPNALLATNTSSIRLEQLADHVPDAGRFLGLHFFNPATHLPLVEVVRGERTSQDAYDRALAFAEAIDKLPLPVKSSPGFLVNRILTPYLLEAMQLMEEGHSPQLIDKAAEDFGMQQGPIEVADAVGLDVCLHVGRILARDLPGSPEPPARLHELVEKGRLGKKTGKGFYDYDGDGNPNKEDVEDDADTSELQRRLIDPLIKESEKALADGVVSTSDLVDLGAVFGAGFAPFRGGPCHFLAERDEVSEAEAAGIPSPPD